MKTFYSHLAYTSEIRAEMDRYQIDVVEKEEIIQLADEHFDQRILHVILTHLPKEKHDDFLEKFHKTPHDKSLLDYLKKDVADIEKLISDEAKAVRDEIIREIKNASR